MRTRYNGGNLWASVSAVIIIVIALVVIAASPIIHFSTMETVRNLEIIEKERIVVKESSKYLIFTDREVFENVDSLWALKFDSSDYYRNIRVGQFCTLTVTGFRIPVLSSYRNIVGYSCKEKSDVEKESDIPR